jgi:putative ABC transport system permease protein
MTGFFRQIRRGLDTLLHRVDADRDVDDEVRHYLEQTTAAYIASGMTPDAARRAAQMEIGNTTVVREQVRDYGWENFVDTAIGDFRYAVRRLRSNPGFAIVSTITLGLGIGASTAIFSAVNPILFEALPYPHAERVVMLWDRTRDGGQVDVTFGTHREVLARSHSFDAIAAMKAWQPTMTSDAEPERLEGQRVSAGYFRALGVAPAVGRDFTNEDDQVNGPNVVVLSDAVWRRRFAANPGVVGRPITLDGRQFTVIGVMPASLENIVAPNTGIWTPLQYDASLPANGREWGHHLRMIARLRPGVSTAQAERELSTIGRSPVPAFARPRHAMMERGLSVVPLQDDVTRGVKPALLAVLGAVLLVLVIACVNVTNLLLARGAQRRGELAMRAALGAGQGRLLRQLLTESVVLALIGGVLGMGIAALGVRALVILSPPGLPRVDAIHVDATVLVFGLVLTTLVGVVVGLVPAFHAARGDLREGMQSVARRAASSHRFTRGTLVVTEVALAFVLLASAGLLLRSLERLFAIEPGFEPSGLLTMQVQTAGQHYGDTTATRQFFEQSLEAVRRVPGVTAAAYTSQLPLSGDFENYGAQFEAFSSRADEGQAVLRYAVTPGYFETMGIALRRGRFIEPRDAREGPVAVLINESLARRKFPGQEVIGQRLHLGRQDIPWYTIVGVVADVKQTSLAAQEMEAVYVPVTRWYSQDRALRLVVRTQGNPAALATSVRNAVWSIDKDQPITHIATMQSLVAATAGERRFALVLFEAFGLAALVLAGTGIYGVISGSVTERLREIGVRAALGASRGRILALIVRQGMTPTIVGVVLGSVGALLASRALTTLLYSTSPRDPLTYVGVVWLLLGVAAAACWIPAMRAARVDPASTLRTD